MAIDSGGLILVFIAIWPAPPGFVRNAELIESDMMRYLPSLIDDNELNIALQRYEGTVFLVTHDQDLLEEVGTRLWNFEHGKIEDHKGPYEEWLGKK